MEETGLEVGRVTYEWCVSQVLTSSSQPWPFPAQLMFGLFAYIKHPNANVRLDLDDELEEVFFATRNEVQTILESRQDNDAQVFMRHGYKVTYVQRDTHRHSVPGRRALAHTLLRRWAYHPHHVEVSDRSRL